MKKIAYVLFLFALPLWAVAQNSNVLTGDENTEPQEGDLKIVVIPFHPIKYYFSDCDKKLAQKSELHIQDIRHSFRAGLDYASENWLEKKYEPINLYQMKDSQTVEIMEEFYDNVGYSYDVPSRTISKDNKKFFAQIKKKARISKARKATKEGIGDEDCYTQVDAEEDRYMKLTFKNREFLDKLNETYRPDYYVTINQFEVITDLDRCIDRELGKYRRRIKVHYNVFTANGDLVYGDVVTAKYDSNSDNVNKIIQDNFGFLGEYITQSVPR